MKRLLISVLIGACAGSLAFAATTRSDEYAMPTEATKEKAPSGIEWTNEHEAELAKATADATLATLVANAESARALLDKVTAAYATDPLTAFQIGALSQYVMRPAGAARRPLWRAALLERLSGADDDYVKTFCLDQLRWSGTAEDVAAIRQRTLSSSKAVVDFAAFVIRELEGRPAGQFSGWKENDPARPLPPKVTAAEGVPPSDAVVLVGAGVDSCSLFTDSKGRPTRWKLENGVFVPSSKAGDAWTKESFADYQLHAEFLVPPGGGGKHPGNSGILPFAGRRYEVQILDTFGNDPKATSIRHPIYADGLCGAIYGQEPPLVNVARKGGEWQSFEIVFHAPVWERGRLVVPGTMSVFHNGVLVQDHVTLKERVSPPKDDCRFGRIVLQDHGYPVRFRNVWLRKL